VFSGTLCPLPALVFDGGRVSASDSPAAAARFPPLGGGDAPVVLPISLAIAVVAEEAVAKVVASTMVVGLPDTTCASQSETRVSDVAVNVCFMCQGGLPFYLRAGVTGPIAINV
jgi:hypothetical protein